MNRKDAGFTLIELLVSLTLIGIVITGVTTLFTSIQSVQRRTAYMETATREAQRQMESLRNNNYNNLAVGQTIDFTNQLPSTLRGPSGTVTVSEPSPGLKRVDINVSYYEGDQQQQVNLSSLVGILGITQ
jgi:prepilin-type N-terminal cleavage/methylation domain-containing protein